jgi:hypothetical protein
VTSPLPLAGEVEAEGFGWGKSLLELLQKLCGGTPTPALPRKRERERIPSYRNTPPVFLFTSATIFAATASIS